MSSLKLHGFVSSGSRLLLQCHLIKSKNCYSPKLLQDSSWNLNILNCRGMCTDSSIDPLCKQPVFHPKKGELVYVGQASKHCFYVKSLSLATCTVGVCMQPYLYFNADNFSLPLLVALIGSVGFFTVITTGLIQFITKKYVTDIYFNKNTGKFTAARLSFFLRRKEIEYTTDDVEVPPFPGMFTTMKIKGKPYLIDENNFKDVDVFIHMVGYDKPMDFKQYVKEKRE